MLEPNTSETILKVQKVCSAFLVVHGKKLSHESFGSFHMLFKVQHVDLGFDGLVTYANSVGPSD